MCIGTRPLITAWKKWNINVLEPANHLKHLMKEKSDEGSSGKSPRKKIFELDALLKESEEIEQKREQKRAPPKRDESLKSDSGKSVRISLSNFNEELAASLANEKIHISASKEKLVKTQAQATREMLTKRTRTAEQARAKPPPPGKVISIEAKQPAKTVSQQQSPVKKPTTSAKGKMSVPKAMPRNYSLEEYVTRNAPPGLKQKLERTGVISSKQPQYKPGPTKSQATVKSMVAPPRRISQLNGSALARNATQLTKIQAPLKSLTQRGIKPPANPNPRPPPSLKKQNGDKSADKSDGVKKNLWKDRAMAILKRNKESEVLKILDLHNFCEYEMQRLLFATVLMNIIISFCVGTCSSCALHI